jgi:hypothetical protein
VYPSLPVVAALAVGMGLLAMFGGEKTPERESDNEGIYEPPTDPSEVVSAIHDVLISSANPRSREKLEKLLRERLTFQIGDSWQILFPVDIEGSLSFKRVNQIATAVGEFYVIPMAVERVLVKKVPFAVITVGSSIGIEPNLSWATDSDEYGRHMAATNRGRSKVAYGGIVDLIVNSVISSAVGTVTSMGVQDLVHSMGGERRLARIMRHYKKAEDRGDTETMDRIKKKMTKSASRIQGRKVDWSEIESLTGVARKD